MLRLVQLPLVQLALPLAFSEQDAAIVASLDRSTHVGFNPSDIA